MKVFVTGATGFVGTAVVQELLANGHKVLGLARSEESANKLIAAGAEAHRGDLNDFESLKSGAEASDAVIHLGFVHDFTKFEEMCKLDGKVIETIGDALIGTEKPFLITSGTALFSKDRITTEKDLNANNPHPRIATENSADAVAAKGVKVAVIRLSPSVHGKGDIIGFVPTLINIAKQKGKSAAGIEHGTVGLPIAPLTACAMLPSFYVDLDRIYEFLQAGQWVPMLFSFLSADSMRINTNWTL